MSEKFYITTPIYYPSGKFHIGTAYTEILADTTKRYKKLRGYDTYLLTGLDEHGQKIETVAKEKGKTPQEHVNEMANETIKLWEKMDIQYDDFIRTTEHRHEKIVQEIFEKLLKQGDIYLGEYEGWYCLPCETYFTETQLVDGKCPDCGREVKRMKEESYFFNMKKYQKRLEEFYEQNPNFIEPVSRKNELFNNFIKPGMEDLCVSRTSFDWGIKVKENPKHVIYVWLDALTNYITALGYLSDDDSKFKKYWPADLQIIGKDIIRFHGIYWPIFLMALGLQIPKKIYAHGFISIKNGKMSKSKGNVIYPDQMIDRYGLDATKYYLLREFPYDKDMTITPENFVNRYNGDLANDLGNLLNRTIGMINKYFNGELNTTNTENTEFDKALEELILAKVKETEENLDNLHYSDALEKIWEIVSRSNKYIDDTRPWLLFKSDEREDKQKLISIMVHLVEALRIVAVLLQPFMNETANKIFSQLNINEKDWNSAYEFNINRGIVKVTKKAEPLFTRLEVEKEMEYLEDLIKGTQAKKDG